MSGKLKIKRNDLSEDRSLRPWSAADEYLLQAVDGLENKPNNIAIYNDRFGYLGCHLHSYSPTLILTHKSQEKAVALNFAANKIDLPSPSDPLSTLDKKMDCALVKVPKSLGQFRLFLEHISHNSDQDVTVICAFMTRHFSPGVIQIAREYFEVAGQSKAQKKARLLTLSKKKKVSKGKLTHSLDYKGQSYEQYLGVFSADHIDYATQFFLEHIELDQSDQKILDLASGNGIIGNEVLKQLPDAEIHLMDDAFLAVASAELNVKGENVHHHYNDELSIFEDGVFDLIVTNPPFHFEHEINIQVPLALFRDCFRCLKKGGNLQIVASQHLNYKVHLTPIFSSVEVLAEDKKFIVYRCLK